MVDILTHTFPDRRLSRRSSRRGIWPRGLHEPTSLHERPLWDLLPPFDPSRLHALRPYSDTVKDGKGVAGTRRGIGVARWSPCALPIPDLPLANYQVTPLERECGARDADVDLDTLTAQAMSPA